MKTHCLLLSAALIAPAFSAVAANPTTESLDSALVWNAPDEFPEHGEPNIKVVTSSSKFALGIGGMVKATTGFDWGAPLDDDYAFVTSEISTAPRNGNGAAWRFSAQNSMVYLNAVFLPDSKNRVGAYINFNFNGDNYCPELQYAYLHWRNFSAGYAYTLFTDQNAAAPTIDYQGPNSFTGVQMPVINYETYFGRNRRFRFGIGLNMPMASITDGNNAASVSQRLPDIPVYFQVNGNDGDGHLRVSFLLRNLYYRDLLTAKNVDKVGWGVKVSGVTPAMV